MQIGNAKKEELMLLINGLRSAHVADQAELQHKLTVQLETELASRYGVMIGTADEQARNRSLVG